MADHANDFNSQRPWARTGFDIEGWVLALAALLFGIYAGTLWYPLFIIGVVGAGIALAATRRVERSMPEGAFIALAPCDGVVSSVDKAVPPAELELGGDEFVRVRISSSPFSPNPVFAPVTGAVTASAFEEGDPSRLFASSPDLGGLEVSYLTIGSGKDAVGLKIMTAGFGPRLDVETETGDLLRAGRKFAKRRLGGWCDIYLPAGTEAAVWPGQTLVGGETELAIIDDTWVVRDNSSGDEKAEEPEERSEPIPDVDLETLGTSHVSPETDETAKNAFERLRREAQGLEDND